MLQCCPLILLPSLTPFSNFPLFVLELELTLAPPMWVASSLFPRFEIEKYLPVGLGCLHQVRAAAAAVLSRYLDSI
jgi:hypothetical protein